MPLASLSAGKGAFVHPKGLGQLPLRKAQEFTTGYKFFRQRFWGWIRVITQELDKPRYKANRRAGFIALPVIYRGFGNSYLFSYLFSQEAKVKPFRQARPNSLFFHFFF
jgi:hypothetical protein